jgi:hypothetical protein
MTPGMLGALLVACSPAPAPISPQVVAVPPITSAIEAPPAPQAPPPPPLACEADADCGYDPAGDRCVADPRANRQPPLVDQGIVCFCDDRGLCATLRVPPVPCESDESCAVRLDPRPHPVAADASHPHERGRACRDFTLATTCERTNICTMHRLSCKGSRK